jgi:hypothetical protein
LSICRANVQNYAQQGGEINTDLPDDRDKQVWLIQKANVNYTIGTCSTDGSTRISTSPLPMWLRMNGKDADSSNTECLVADPNFTTVMGEGDPYGWLQQRGSVRSRHAHR